MELTVDIVKKIDVQYLRLLSSLLKTGQMKAAEAKKNARAFLELIPFNTFDEMKQKITSFTTIHPQFNALNITIMQIEEEHKTKGVLDKMRALMQQNKVDEMVDMAK
jgi:hypothetical protein